MTRSKRALAGLVAAMALGALTAGAAKADVKPIAGTPMSLWVGAQGQLQGLRAGDTSNIFFAPSLTSGDAGFSLSFPDVPASGTALAQNATLKTREFGFTGTATPTLADTYTPRSQADATGAGTDASPFKQVTTYAVNPTPGALPAGDVALITQTVTYINGRQLFDVQWDVKNLKAEPLRFRAIAAADFYFEGSDQGTGIFTQGPPRFVGGTNADTGRSGGFIEVGAPSASLPWSHYEALEYGSSATQVWGKLNTAGDALTPSLADTVLGTSADNAGAVEWDQYLEPTRTLAQNATATFALTVRTALPAALQFDKTNAGSPQGVPVSIIATAKDTADLPFAGKTLRYTITGANPGTYAVTIGTDGTASMVDPGTNAGDDTIVAYADLNNNSVREPNEPQASALVTFVDNIPPKCTVAVSGDRPGGGGGAGKPLIITVNCDSPATVTTTSSLTITPKATAKKVSTSATAAAKKKGKKKKVKRVVVKLKTTTVTVVPGQAFPVSLTIPKSTAKKYAGAKVTATVTVTAVDTAGNRSSVTTKKTVTLGTPKVTKKKNKR